MRPPLPCSGMYIRAFLLFALVGILAGFIPAPHCTTDEEPATGVMSPFYRTLSGLYGNR